MSEEEIQCAAKNTTTQHTPSVQQYITPTVFTVGVIGNVLNLLVLNSKTMRSKTNYFLSSMAVADLGFFFVMIIYSLASFPTIAASPGFNKLYMHSKMALTALANWFSTSSTWLAIAVTCERLLAIRKPLHAKLLLKKKKIITLIALIYALSLPLFSYTFVWHKPIEVTVQRCNMSRTWWTIQEINRTEHPWLENYVKLSLKLVPNVSITIPLFVLIVFNSLLLYSLNKSRKEAAQMGNNQHHKAVELRVAMTVAITIAAFLLFQLPSAVLYLWDAINGSRNRPMWFYTVTTVSNVLVSTGKAVNFIIYCASSKNFRIQLLRLFRKGRARNDRSSFSLHKNSTQTPAFSSSASAYRVTALKVEENNKLLGGSTVHKKHDDKQ
ncbi:putative G-protein coupled receptor F59B2.13 [Trichinella pseudospiralis]|uniref:Putative G-protein coupled receptor F59B2.13 n=1 Tax=Trichinella pseudospiralis TaxID=6337 RepID=A0A0V1G5V1_TRIPS|nr:putative G-protein coupled receptor F59B2.13 [Trichinella pseudospiralis]